METIPEGVVRRRVLSLNNLGLLSLHEELLDSSPGAAPFRSISGRHFSRLTYKKVLRSLVASLRRLEMLQWIHGLEKFMFHESGVFI